MAKDYGSFQTPKTIRPNRSDHVWIIHNGSYKYKCCLCGALTDQPPPYPTPPEWLPHKCEPLTDEERAMSPYLPTKV